MRLGPYAIEQDYSYYVSHASEIILAIVGTATKGPINTPTVCTSPSDLISKFGNLNPNCMGLYAAHYFLNQSSKLWYVRAASDAAAAPTVSISGVATGGATVADAIVLRCKNVGTANNGYQVVISEVDTATHKFTLTVKNAASTALVLETITDIDFSTLTSLNFTSNYLEIASKSAAAVNVSDGTYTLSGGNDGISSSQGTPVAATVRLSGKDSEDTTIENAVLMTSITAGATTNGYIVSISDVNAEAGTFTFTVKNNATPAVVLETLTNVAFDDLDTAEFTSQYVTVNSVRAPAVKLIAGDYMFVGGNSGNHAAIAAADFITAANTLANMNIDMNLFAVPGVSDPSLITAMLSLAETRGDCLYLVDPPNVSTIQAVSDYHNGVGNYSHGRFNSSYGAIYFAWQKIYDPYNRQTVEVPPSVVVAPAIARSQAMSEIWYAPAGLQRGLVKGVIQSKYTPDTNEVHTLYSGDNSVNCIINDPQVGLCIFGQKTLSRLDTALNRVNVRLLLNYLKRVVVAACSYMTFEPNDRMTWNNFEDLIEPTLKSIKNLRGLYAYRIVKGESIVTDSDIDNYRMPCRILIQPTKSAEEIPIYFTITSTGADFNEVLESETILEIE